MTPLDTRNHNSHDRYVHAIITAEEAAQAALATLIVTNSLLGIGPVSLKEIRDLEVAHRLLQELHWLATHR